MADKVPQLRVPVTLDTAQHLFVEEVSCAGEVQAVRLHFPGQEPGDLLPVDGIRLLLTEVSEVVEVARSAAQPAAVAQMPTRLEECP